MADLTLIGGITADGIATVSSIVGVGLLHFFFFGRIIGRMEEKINLMFNWFEHVIRPDNLKSLGAGHRGC